MMSLLAALPLVYPITHRTPARPCHVRQVRLLLGAGATLIQLREKAPAEVPDLLDQARECARLCREVGAVLIVNDDVELAIAAGAHGVHVGQGDMAPSAIRQRAGSDFLIGLSTHDRAQFEAACRQPAAYIAVGPVFATSTKPDAEPATGLDFVRWAWKHPARADRPLVAIGGISKATIGKLMAIVPRAVPSVISAVWSSNDPAAEYEAFAHRVASLREFLADASEGPNTRASG